MGTHIPTADRRKLARHRPLDIPEQLEGEPGWFRADKPDQAGGSAGGWALAQEKHADTRNLP